MKKVITTVGTSIFTNYLDYHKDIKEHYDKVKDVPHREWESSHRRLDRIRKPVSEWVIGNEMASAEIKSILRLQQELNEELEVILLTTDTVLSRLAAEIIMGCLENKAGITVYFEPPGDVISGLQVTDRIRFEKEGLVNLIKRLYDLWGGYSDNVILNITGGYKGVIPYLTIMGQVNGIPTCYLFEDTTELLWIPQAPLDIGWGMFEKYSQVFRQFTEETIIEGWADFKRRNNIGGDFQACIREEENSAILNAIGEMFWEKYQRFFVVYLPAGGKYFREEPTRKRNLEKAIQELYRRLEQRLEHFTRPLTGIELGDDLRHVDVGDSSVYKHTKPQQIRIQYTLTENKAIKIFNYYFINSDADDKHYSRYMNDQYDRLKNMEFTAIPFEIKEV
ncbi:MAG: putative CRISPR-associated protein [Bacillota bacterium]